MFADGPLAGAVGGIEDFNSAFFNNTSVSPVYNEANDVAANDANNATPIQPESPSQLSSVGSGRDKKLLRRLHPHSTAGKQAIDH